MSVLLGTIENEGYKCDVMQDEDGRVYFTGDADIDADGANGQAGGPAAYKADNSGREDLRNGGMDIRNGKVVCVKSGARNIVILDDDNEPKVFPGNVIASKTWYRHLDKSPGDPRAYVDSETVPYVVVPSLIVQKTAGVVRGCKARVSWNGKSVDCVVADRGPANKIGELSIAAARALGINDNPRIGGRETPDVFYELWPGIAAPGYELQSSVAVVHKATKIDAPTGQPSTSPARLQAFLDLAQGQGQGAAAQRLADYKSAHHAQSNPRYWAIVDFGQPSREKRFYLFDTDEDKVDRFYVSHGRGSDPNHDGVADSFSNIAGSNQSSLGIFRCAETYSGNHGRSLRVDGLEDTNSKARDRSIVLHKADYVSDLWIDKHGKIGRSEGCFAVDNRVSDELIDKLRGGSFLVAWQS